MKKTTTSAAIVRTIFERFCLTAGIGTLASIIEEDATRVCGPQLDDA